MKILKLFLFITLLAWQVSFSQTNKSIDLQIAQLENPASFNSNIDLIDKAILQQVVDVNQFNSANQFEGNSAIILQFGNGNTANLKQNGSGNKSASIQKGDDNSYDLTINGDDNKSFIAQYGKENTINQQLNGDNLFYAVLQFGNNNEVTQIESGQQSKQYEVRQYGNDMKIKIVDGPLR